MIICISGTPGTGKSYIARRISKNIGTYLDLNGFIKKEKLYDDYDRSDKTYDVDVKKLGILVSKLFSRYNYDKSDPAQRKTYSILQSLVDKNSDSKNNNDHSNNKIKTTIQSITLERFLKEISKVSRSENNIIIDSHLSHNLECDFCIIVKSDIKTLKKRLSLRRYSKKKIEDNIQSEIFDICLEEAQSKNKIAQKIIVIDNSGGS